jgi:para-nitrobenzyl esterase
MLHNAQCVLHNVSAILTRGMSVVNSEAQQRRRGGVKNFMKSGQTNRITFSRDRRALLGGMAGLCAGLAAPSEGLAAQPAPEAATIPAASDGCGRSKVACSDAATVVETAASKVRGYQRNGIYIFKGIPYGASTAGERRFMPPARPEPWTGIRNALAYGRICPQSDSAHFDFDGRNLAPHDEDAFLLHRGAAICVPGEDCLRVNVWTPEINGSHKRPVMVYMHGGGYSGGCGHDLLSYEGESLARNHDVVVVNHNHRLNVYGYLNLEAIGGNRFAQSANVGMLDIVAVLEWVRTHIASFGGDAENVTIFGQSGGGGKVAVLLAMPGAQGLFHRAIIESGPFLRALTPDYSQQVAQAVLDELGLSRSQMKALQRVPVDRLSGAAVEAMKKMAQSTPAHRGTFGESGWGPTVDGSSLPVHPFDPAAPAISANVPLITGTNLNESVSGLDHPDANRMTQDEMKQRVREMFAENSDPIIAAYREEYPQETPFGIYAAIATSRWRIPAFTQAERKTALGAAPAYSYIYAWRTPVLDNRVGTFHASEISFVLDNAEICDHYSAGDPGALTLSRQMSAAWVSFARTGNPNHAGLLHWPAYTAGARPTMYFNQPCRVQENAEGKGLALMANSERG